MSHNTTQISDLPENIKMQNHELPTAQDAGFRDANIHYPPKPLFPNNNEPQNMVQPPQHQLPSRDIPMNSAIHQDPAAHPNYVPPPPEDTRDYLRDYEEASRQHFVRREVEKQRESKIDYLFSEMQLPLLIGILFFIFQMPIAESFFMRNFSFMSIHYDDGNINIYGIVLKSLLFGSVFYGIHKTIDYLTII